MRLSHPRLILRIVLLLSGGLYLLALAVRSGRSAIAFGGAHMKVGLAVSFVGGLVGLMALVTAGLAALSLRRRSPGNALDLAGADREKTSDPPGPPVGERDGAKTGRA